MNLLPNQNSVAADGSDQMIVSLLVTETTVLTKAEGNATSNSCRWKGRCTTVPPP
jgi:hypothetical protein